MVGQPCRASLLFYRGVDALARQWRPITAMTRILPGVRRAAFAAHHDPEGLHRLLNALFAIRSTVDWTGCACQPW